MVFVRLNPSEDFNKPYKTHEYIREEVKKMMQPVIEALKKQPKYRVYDNPGIHGMATFEEAEECAHRHGGGTIMECPESVGSRYGTGWHVIVSYFVPHWEDEGYIKRARVVTVTEHFE